MHRHLIVIAGFVAFGLFYGGCGKDASRPSDERGSGSTASRAPGAAGGKGAIELAILYGSEKKSWLEESIAAYNRQQPAGKTGRAIRVTGKAVGSGEAMTAILDGTERPAVFSPASGAYVTLLNEAWQSRGNHTKPIAPSGEPLVLSPIVIAMWRPMAEALGWPDKPIGWNDILSVSRDRAGWGKLSHPEWGAMKLGHTHPEYSNSGLQSVLAIAYAGAKTTRGLSVADLPKVERFM